MSNSFPPLHAGFSHSVGRPRTRRGMSMTELVVSATLLVTSLAVVTPLAVRAGRAWQDSRHYRLAMDEVSNQLDRLTLLDESRLTAALESLEPSPHILSVLPRAALSAERVNDEDGSRIILSLRWERVAQAPAVALVGWMEPPPITSPEIEEAQP